MNYNTLMNKPTINYRELIGDNTVSEVGGITEEQFNTLLDTDLASYYTKAQIDDLFSRSYVYREKSGSIVTFDCPASVNGIDKVVSDIVAVQSGTGDPSPQNVRPFSGWSAVNRYVASEQLFNGEYPYIDSTVRKITLDVGEGSFTMVSTIPLYVNAGQNVANIFLQTGTGETTASSDLDGVWDGHPITVNSTDGKVTIKYRIFNNIGVCDPRRYETWLARSITTYTTQLKDGQGNPLTCYGGGLMNAGGSQALLVTKGHIASYNGETLPSTWESDRDVYAEGTTPSIGAEVVYELETPIQIPQDSLSIISQSGTNNIWCDSGDITVRALDKIIQE